MDNLSKNFKKVAILGIGTEGLALVDFLRDKAERITILDRLSEVEILERLEGEELKKFEQISDNKNIEKIYGEDYLDNLDKYDIVFRSPGISINNPKIQAAKNAGVDISSQIKLFFELCPCKIIGVTGTKGKGTTASLIFSILEKGYQSSVISHQSDTNNQLLITNNQPNVFLAGNIGYPAITLIPKIKENDIVILELSSFQLMDLEKSPHIAIVTNLSEDHLDYHTDAEEYKEAKFNIIKYQREGDIAILNKTSTFSAELLEKVVSEKQYFCNNGMDSRFRGNDNRGAGDDNREVGNNDVDAVVTNNSVILDPENRNIEICKEDEIKLFGSHNLENIAAATLTASTLSIKSNIISEAVKNFNGLAHRLELVAEIDGVKYINDSYATNPEPTIAAINSFPEPKILILGGSSKGADFSTLANKIEVSNTKSIILIDPEGQKIKQALHEAGFGGKIIEGVSSIDEIVQKAREKAQSGDIIILSPACASFGMFKNYKDRGEKFKNEVLKLQK